MNAIMFTSLAASCLAISFGLVRLAAWIYDQRQAAAVRAIAQASFAARIEAEYLADTTIAAERNAELASDATSGYYFQEIEATKRGDLLAAARFAELCEVRRA